MAVDAAQLQLGGSPARCSAQPYAISPVAPLGLPPLGVRVSLNFGSRGGAQASFQGGLIHSPSLRAVVMQRGPVMQLSPVGGGAGGERAPCRALSSRDALPRVWRSNLRRLDARKPTKHAIRPVAAVADSTLDGPTVAPKLKAPAAADFASKASIKVIRWRQRLITCVGRDPVPQPMTPWEQHHHTTRLCPLVQVVGVGGGGSNAVNRMLQSELQGVDFWVLNTDAQVRAGLHLERGLSGGEGGLGGEEGGPAARTGGKGGGGEAVRRRVDGGFLQPLSGRGPTVTAKLQGRGRRGPPGSCTRQLTVLLPRAQPCGVLGGVCGRC